MIIYVCGKKVSTVNAGWFGLLFSTVVILPCLMALTFADDITQRIMDIPDINCKMSYDRVLRDLMHLCRIAILLAGLNMIVSGCLILEWERYMVPRSWRTIDTTRINSVFVFNMADSATVAVPSTGKSEKSEKPEKLDKLEKSEKPEKSERPEISIV